MRQKNPNNRYNYVKQEKKYIKDVVLKPSEIDLPTVHQVIAKMKQGLSVDYFKGTYVQDPDYDKLNTVSAIEMFRDVQKEKLEFELNSKKDKEVTD